MSFSFLLKGECALLLCSGIYGALGSKIRDQAAVWDPFAKVQVENMQSAPSREAFLSLVGLVLNGNEPYAASCCLPVSNKPML